MTVGGRTIDTNSAGNDSWVWFPSWHDLRTHYFHELGFLACSALMFGSTVFWVAGFTSLPPIFRALDGKAEVDGAYWIPQIVGGVGFIVSGALFTIETQNHWWQPAPSILGWHVGFWNFVGGIGFTLCSIFGLFGQRQWALYQGSCSTFWGSWAFLIGSVLQ